MTLGKLSLLSSFEDGERDTFGRNFRIDDIGFGTIEVRRGNPVAIIFLHNLINVPPMGIPTLVEESEELLDDSKESRAEEVLEHALEMPLEVFGGSIADAAKGKGK